MKAVLALLSLASLAVCLAAPFLYLHGRVTMGTYKSVLLAASLTYLVFATLWAMRRTG